MARQRDWTQLIPWWGKSGSVEKKYFDDLERREFRGGNLTALDQHCAPLLWGPHACHWSCRSRVTARAR